MDNNELDTLFLMILCKAGIASNSTYSWWGIYLNINEGPFYFPNKIFIDMNDVRKTDHTSDKFTIVDV